MMDSRICRLCLDAKDLLTSPSLYDGVIQAKITTIFNFPFESRASLPSGICTHCLLKIDEFHEYAETVRLNQEELKSRETVLARVSVKVEPAEKNEPSEAPECLAENEEELIVPIKSERSDVAPDAIQTEYDEARVVSIEANQCIVQSHQDETVQFKIEFEDAQVASEMEPTTERADKIEKEDRLIRDFFSLKCETCSMQFDTFSRLKQHTTVMHDKKLIFKCCNKVLSRRYNLLVHIALHLNPNHFQCDGCDKTYQRKVDLNNHRLKAHGSDAARPFKCEQCPASFPKSYLLKAHLTKHVLSPCDICQKVLSNPVALRNHKIQVHSDGNKHVCDVCGVELSSKPALLRHEARHKTVVPEDRIACQICTKLFATEEHLRNHIKNLHEGFETTCDVCQQVYPNKKAMHAHKWRVHSKAQKTHECDICGKTYTRKLNLTEHYSTHTGEKLYRCDLCGKSISSSSFLYKHRKRKHPAEWLAEKQKAYAGTQFENTDPKRESSE